jgi:hypothetical protein
VIAAAMERTAVWLAALAGIQQCKTNAEVLGRLQLHLQAARGYYEMGEIELGKEHIEIVQFSLTEILRLTSKEGVE